ncbi:MAG TPA: ABC transporter substrate-binding protein [Acidimicrobiia bacterium]|nr:ABC transporter substrate-binding protein [Acidimicrobiia bacterium]
MRRNRLIKLASVVTVACLGAALSVVPAGAQGAGGLVIGSLAPETGDLSAIVESLRTPVQIAVDEINAAGGVGGADVTFVTGDDGTDPEVAGQSLDTLVTSDKANIIIGPASSGTALGILPKIKTDDVLVCSGSNTSAQLTNDGPKKSGGRYKRTAPPDGLQGPALSELVLADGNSNVGILVRNDSYGVGFGKSLAKALEQGGATVVANVAYDPEAASFDADVQKVADESPDAVVIIGFNDDGAKVVQTMIGKGIGPADIGIYTADGMQGSSFGETVDPANPGVVAGIKGTAPAAAPAGIESPFQDVFDATGVDPIFSSYYYDCTILAALAAVKADSTSAKAMAKAFAKNTKGSNECNTFSTCKDLLESGEKIRYSGASSTFENFGKNEPKSGVYEIWSYDAAAEVVAQDASTQISIG